MMVRVPMGTLAAVRKWVLHKQNNTCKLQNRRLSTAAANAAVTSTTFQQALMVSQWLRYFDGQGQSPAFNRALFDVSITT